MQGRYRLFEAREEGAVCVCTRQSTIGGNGVLSIHIEEHARTKARGKFSVYGTRLDASCDAALDSGL